MDSNPQPFKKIEFKHSSSSSSPSSSSHSSSSSSSHHNNYRQHNNRSHSQQSQNRSNQQSKQFASKYDEAHKQFFDKNHRPTDPPDPNAESLEEFLLRVGFNRLEGHSRAPHKAFYTTLIDFNPWIHRVAEIGFNAGHSAEIFLKAIGTREGAHVVSFDILAHFYANFAKAYIDIEFPGKHSLIGGDSNIVVPGFFSGFKPEPFDLIFIDGDHTAEKAFEDIKNMRKYAVPGRTLVIIDNVSPHCGFGRGVYDAWKKAYDEGLIEHISHTEIDDYRDGWSLFRYKEEVTDTATSGKRKRTGESGDNDHVKISKTDEGDDVMTTKSPLRVSPTTCDLFITTETESPDFDHICRRIEVTELTKKIESTRSADDLEDYGKRLKELDDLKQDKVDSWAKEVYNKKCNDYKVASVFH